MAEPPGMSWMPGTCWTTCLPESVESSLSDPHLASIQCPWRRSQQA